MNSQANVLWQVSSRQADVICFEEEGQYVVEKVIAPLVLNGNGYSNAGWINEVSLSFREKLSKLGVPLMEPYICTVRDGRTVQKSPYAGPDLEQIVQKGNISVELLVGIIYAIGGVLRQEVSEVGIDARLSNFCLKPDGTVVYIDTFPPLVMYNGIYIVHFPNPTEPAVIRQEFLRKFCPLGILRRLRFSILEQDVGFTEKDILQAVWEVMGGEFSARVAGFFQTLPDHQDMTVALEGLRADDTDAIREVALRLMPPKGEGRAEFLQQIFDLSSNFCPLGLTADQRVKRIRKLLIEGVKE